MGTTCPTRDGAKDTRGCIFCSNSGSGDFAFSDLERAKNLVSQKIKGNDKKFLAYFQSFTNTYGKNHEEEKQFTTKEFDLLTFLASHPNHVYTKDELFSEIWDMESIGDIATVTVHIKKIREKIETDTAKPQYIETIWGVGYRFKV